MEKTLILAGPGGHYLILVEHLVALGALEEPAPTVREMVIRHDGWCAIYRGGRCDCDPEIALEGRRWLYSKVCGGA